MPKLLHRRVVLAFALAFPLLAQACNRELQGHAEVFLDALATDDFEKFKSIAGAELLNEVPEANFHDMATTYEALGPEQDRTRTGTAWKNGVGTVNYTLDHAHGEVYMTAVSNGEKLDGIELEGAWKNVWLERQRKGLDALLTALQAGDRVAARALCHPSVPDAEVDQLIATFSKLDKHTSIEVVDAALPEFRVAYPKSNALMRVQMRGKQVASFSSRNEA